MKEITTGLFALFNEKVGSYYNDFYTAVNGRLYDTMAPDGTPMPFAVYFIISDVDVDTFSENMKEVYIQFSLFSDASSSAEIKDMDTALTAMLKDQVFAITGWTVDVMKRVMGNGPMVTQADEAAGTGRFWQTDVDFVLYVSKV
jgi:hypothetical protein